MKFKLTLFTVLLAIICISNTVFAQNTETYYQDMSFKTEDFIYDPYIKTVRLYPNQNPLQAAQLEQPIIPLSQQIPLILTFDELASDARVYKAKIIRCESDWTESTLPTMEYLSVYNDFLIRDYDFSINTKVPFVHYKFEIPKVKISGNYVVKVFFQDEENLILTKRFMVFEESTSIGFEQIPSVGGESSLFSQQFNLSVNYTAISGVVNPNKQFKVVVRQNYRWQNAIYNLKPTFVKDHQKTLEFTSLTESQCFLGSNEFRLFDIRTQRKFGWGVDSVRYQKNSDHVFLRSEKSRSNLAYGTRLEDFNGQFYIENSETPEESATEADYAYVNFVLESQKLNNDVYIIGGLTDWKINSLFKMRYVNEGGYYTAEVLLKQGIYNYFYTTINDKKEVDYSPLENNYRQTENTYDVLIYYRPMSSRTDYLVGYRKI
ncbi:hypothetical protein Fleli_1752 [Bernardetia litoralis DSM 6794]|uniref:Type 9 secretion system plug protein N-terminal domain-containing protein n=1 Tax=Bernardetia litoralis (strain ATCC 23117 / DSM 6794 / NBRC 15988 / NCIMB 1366 / Fx l1 / Sio-4) TaxID=880071 RepID=I4AJL6_BERLS|nr:DUF5103 domain-containing protein [Bernardetia litoralis]AFM04151.1 hypothetical protein Fleli_1752 [Bernardetia litoralis DSM 6794]